MNITDERLLKIIGMHLDDAIKYVSQYNLTIRVIKQDGIDLFVRLNYVPTRLNVEVTDKIIRLVNIC